MNLSNYLSIWLFICVCWLKKTKNLHLSAQCTLLCCICNPVSPTSLPNEAVHEPPSFGGRLVQQPSLGMFQNGSFGILAGTFEFCPEGTGSRCVKPFFQQKTYTCISANALSLQHHANITPASRLNWAVACAQYYLSTRAVASITLESRQHHALRCSQNSRKSAFWKANFPVLTHKFTQSSCDRPRQPPVMPWKVVSQTRRLISILGGCFLFQASLSNGAVDAQGNYKCYELVGLLFYRGMYDFTLNSTELGFGLSSISPERASTLPVTTHEHVP